MRRMRRIPFVVVAGFDDRVSLTPQPPHGDWIFGFGLVHTVARELLHLTFLPCKKSMLPWTFQYVWTNVDIKVITLRRISQEESVVSMRVPFIFEEIVGRPSTLRLFGWMIWPPCAPPLRRIKNLAMTVPPPPPQQLLLLLERIV